MKNMYKILAFICASLLFFPSCIEENFEQQYKPAEIGDEITFGVRAGFEDADPATRTVYGSPYVDEKTNKTFHPIERINGDLIEIYSPEASGINPSCYRITTANVSNPEQGKDYATITRNNPEGSLQWSGDDNHNFYAMYPSSDTFKKSSDENLKAGVKMDKTVVNGIVPDIQNHAGIIEPEEDSKDWIVKPNMDYAYMVAHNIGNRKNDQILLSFYPIVTAVEIQMFFETKSSTTVTNPDTGEEEIIDFDDNISITHVKVESEAMITGSFTCDLKNWTNKTTYPQCTGEAVPGYANSITIPVWYDKTPDDDNTSYDPIIVQDKGTLTFTVFLLPNSNGGDVLNSLKVSVSTNGGSAYVEKDLPGITIKKNFKNRIINLKLPLFSNKTQLNVGNWITDLQKEKPNTPIVGLSIPGTGGSFSFGGGAEGYAQQSSTMDIDAQWNIGVRAFEIVSNRPQSSNVSLGTETVQCNGEDMKYSDNSSITVFSAINDLVTRVTRTTDSEGKTIDNNEFAVAILTYQPVGGQSNPRNAAAYAKSMKLMFDTKVEDGGLKEYVDNGTIILYKPDLTIAQARNKLMILCRINQEGEGEPTESTETGDTPTLSTQNTINNFSKARETLKDYPVILINGCGTAKDKWARRGYNINGQLADNSANYRVDFNAEKNVEYYITAQLEQISGSILSQTYKANYQDDSNVAINTEDINFNYSTNIDNLMCWFQEWARVSPGGNNGYFIAEDLSTSIIDYTSYGYRWKESYTEKLSNATSTFDMAIKGNLNGVLTINSLCGYYIASGNNYNKSYVPYGASSWDGGTNGNIRGLANDLNRDFYQYIINSALKSTTGPTGIVMMDFVSSAPADGGSYYIPGVIIANNF